MSSRRRPFSGPRWDALKQWTPQLSVLAMGLVHPRLGFNEQPLQAGEVVFRRLNLVRPLGDHPFLSLDRVLQVERAAVSLLQDPTGRAHRFPGLREPGLLPIPALRELLPVA